MGNNNLLGKLISYYSTPYSLQKLSGKKIIFKERLKITIKNKCPTHFQKRQKFRSFSESVLKFRPFSKSVQKFRPLSKSGLNFRPKF